MLVILDKLNFYLYKFWGFLKPRRKFGLVSFVILSSLVLALWVGSTNVAHAGSLWNDIAEGLIGVIFAIAGLFIKLTFFILKFVIEVSAYNAFIDSSAVIVGWVMVRDVTNMFFVVVLLLISFGTILGLEQYEYKKLLVKLLMAAIVVNFSRIICGIIIDVAQVIMITFVNGIAATASGNMVNMFGVGDIFKISNGGSPNLSKPGLGEQFLAAVAAITFAAIMMMTMLTFLFLLMARMMTLWILIVLSPFAFVLNVLPQTQKYAGQWWSEFGGNVVAGPIIAFFLWLSFVTVGAGNANNELEKDNPQAISKGNPSDQETSAGLTSIMSWANMANFAIAIGMLLTGAKIAQQLGAAGGAMMSKAGEFGKKVAMTASGVTAARWAGRKALEGGKAVGRGALKVGDFGLSKVGLSTADWKRRGRYIKSTVLSSYYDKQAAKTRKASEIAKALSVDERGNYIETKGLGGGWFKRQLARGRLQFGGYGSFNEEYTRDLETSVENRKELIEHLASVSSMKVGQAKQKSGEELEFNQETGALIKGGKKAVMAERRERINQAIEAGGDVDAALANIGLNKTEIAQAKADYKRLGKANEGKAKAGVMGEYTNAAQGKREVEAMSEYMKGKGEAQEEKAVALKAETREVQQRLDAEKQYKELKAIENLLDSVLGKQSREAQAKATSLKEAVDLQQNKELLLSRADQYKKDGNILRAGLTESQAHSLEINKMKELFKSANMAGDDKANVAARIMSEIKGVRGGMTDDQFQADLDASPEKKEKLRSLMQQRDALFDLNLTSGTTYDPNRAEEEELKELGWDEDFTPENASRRLLSRKIGRKIDANENLGVVRDRFKKLIGEKEYKARMRQEGVHAWEQIAIGNSDLTGFEFSPEVVNGQKTGLTDYNIVETSEASAVSTIGGMLGKGLMNAQKMTRAQGSRKWNKNRTKTVLSKVSKAQAELNANVLGKGYDQRQVANLGNKIPWLADFDNSEEIDMTSLTQQVHALAKNAKDEQAFIDLCTKYLKNVLDRHNITEEELRVNYDWVRPQATGGSSTATTQPTAPTAGGGKRGRKGRRGRRR
jgi:hypothetical protein